MKKAAVGHTILRITHHLLAHETTYHEQMVAELGAPSRSCNSTLAQLTALGYDVTLTPKGPAA